MSRLIDADALLEAIRADRYTNAQDAIFFITNAPTVQREGYLHKEYLIKVLNDVVQSGRMKSQSLISNSLLSEIRALIEKE